MSNYDESPRVGFKTRTNVVSLNVSPDALDEVAFVHYNWVLQGIPSGFPLTFDEYAMYLKSLVAKKVNLVARVDRVSSDYREAVMPSFLENWICRIGDRYYPDSGVKITFNKVKFDCLSDQDIRKVSLVLASIRKQNADFVFDGFEARSLSGLDNAYILDQGEVYSLGGTDPKGYQLAAALAITPADEALSVLFRTDLCSGAFAIQEVAKSF